MQEIGGIMSWGSYCLLLFGLSWALIGIYRWYAVSKGYVDYPGSRSSHSVVTPRGAGIVFSMLWFILLAVTAYLKWIPLKYTLIFLPAGLIAFVGFIDDVDRLSVSVRLAFQIIAALASLYFIDLDPSTLFPQWSLHPYLKFALLTAGIVWMTNLVNFMDGSDGIAASQGIFAFGFGGLFLTWSHGYSLTVLSYGMAALLAGFLTWNWPKASVFMGDSGSGFLGFMIALFALVSFKWFAVPLEIWFILTAAFWFDSTVTLVRRTISGEKFTEAHCLHAYQRLIQGGWSHAAVLVGFLVVNLTLAILAIWAYHQPQLVYMNIGISVCFLTVLYIMVEIYKPMYRTWHAR
jgi:Fuc2NAc and GlcNAc transferase